MPETDYAPTTIAPGRLSPSAKPSRRSILAATTGLFAPGMTLRTAHLAGVGTGTTDIELVLLCARLDDLERQIEALFDPRSATFIEDDDERSQALFPLWKAQEPLIERISAIRATTMGGMRARVRSIVALPLPVGDEPDPNGSRRMTAAVFRDLLGEP